MQATLRPDGTDRIRRERFVVTQSEAAVCPRGVAQPRPWFTATLALAYVGGLGMHWLHRDQHEKTDIAPVLHWLRDSSLAIPLALAAVVLAYVVLDSLSVHLDAGPHYPRVMAHATVAAVFYALGSIPGTLIHARLFGAEHEAVHREGHGSTHDAGVVAGWEHLSRDACAALLLGVTALLVHAAAAELARRIRRQHAPYDEPRTESVTA